LAQEQAVVRRDAVGVGCHLALEDIDVAAGKEIAQMVVGAPVAEADFKEGARQGVDGRLQEIEAVALRLHARDEAVEPAHGVVQASVLAVASRSFVLVSTTRWASSRIISMAIVGNSPTMR